MSPSTDSCSAEREDRRENAIREYIGWQQADPETLTQRDRNRIAYIRRLINHYEDRAPPSPSAQHARPAPGEQLGPWLLHRRDQEERQKQEENRRRDRNRAIEADMLQMKAELKADIELLKARTAAAEARPVQHGGSSSSGGPPPVLPAKAPPLLPPKAPPPLMPPKAPPGQPPWQPLVPPPAWPAPGAAHRAPPHEAAPRAPLPPQLVLPQHIINMMLRANREVPVHGAWIGRSRFARFVLANADYHHWPATFQEGKRCERVIAYHGTTESGLEGILRCGMALPGPASRGWGDIISCVGFRVEHAEDAVAAAVAILNGFIPRYRKHQVCCIVEFLVIAEVRTYYSSKEYHQSMAMNGRPDLCVCRFPRDHLGTKVMSIPSRLAVPSALILDTAFV
jgi:hypothetical protein